MNWVTFQFPLPLCKCLVYGFNQTTFVGTERGVNYVVEVGLQSGTDNAVTQGSVALVLTGTTSKSNYVAFSFPIVHNMLGRLAIGL